MKRKGIWWAAVVSAANSRHCATLVPAAMASWLAFKITGPSAMGSEKGICISIRSTPASTI